MFNFLLQGKVGEMMAPVQSQEAQLLIAIQNRQQDKVRTEGDALLPCCTGETQRAERRRGDSDASIPLSLESKPGQAHERRLAR